MVATYMSIRQKCHPIYLSCRKNWVKWRYVMGDSESFVLRYLQKFSKRETNADFATRRKITPNPAYAKSSLVEIKNTIYKCMREIKRIGGPTSYQEAINGLNGGVDLELSNMNYFIGMNVLPELLAMARVGVYVDRSDDPLITKADAKKSRPYVYVYVAEDIRSWAYDSQGVLSSVLLKENKDKIDPETGLVIGVEEQYRLLRKTDDGVVVKITNNNEDVVSETTLNLKNIPFVIAEISDSLLEYTADYQIALMNMESSDISYSLKSNFPFYTEQYTPTARHFAGDEGQGETSDLEDDPEGHQASIGTRDGRRYMRGLERPGFIHPSSEPLKASMEKEESMKQTIRHLMLLTIASLKPIRESAESKEQDQTSLQDGLSYIGLELERLEAKIALIWADYEGATPATIKYPEEYDSRSLIERLNESEKLVKTLNLPSLSYKKEVAKLIASNILGNRVSHDTLIKIHREIDTAPGVNIDPDVLHSDVEHGLVDKVTAALIRTYPESGVAKAKEEEIDRLTQVALAQSSASPSPEGIRGVTPGAADNDKDDPTNIVGKKQQRGNQKSKTQDEE